MTALDDLEKLAAEAQVKVQDEANRKIAQRGTDPWVLRLATLEFNQATEDDPYLRAVSPKQLLALIVMARFGETRTQARLAKEERSAAMNAACGLAFDHGRLLEENRALRQAVLDAHVAVEDPADTWASGRYWRALDLLRRVAKEQG